MLVRRQQRISVGNRSAVWVKVPLSCGQRAVLGNLLEVMDPCERRATRASGEFRNAVGGQTGQLETDVSVPALDTPQPRKPKPVEDDDFSDNSIYR